MSFLRSMCFKNKITYCSHTQIKGLQLLSYIFLLCLLVYDTSGENFIRQEISSHIEFNPIQNAGSQGIGNVLHRISPNRSIRLFFGQFSPENEVNTLLNGQSVYSMHFQLMPSWSTSNTAITIYIILFIGVIYGLWRRQLKNENSQTKNVNKDKKLLLQKESLRKENEQLLKQQKKLEDQVRALDKKVKDKAVELAKKAKESDDKNKVLQQLKEKLHSLRESKVGSKEIVEMLRLIDSNIELDDKTFEIQIDELQKEYYKNLKETYPNLSTYDLRLCAYVRMGLSSKEIAQIQGVLPSSVNVSRSRLRKKLDLDTGDDLFAALNQF